jgi:hypothetical protein
MHGNARAQVNVSHNCTRALDGFKQTAATQVAAVAVLSCSERSAFPCHETYAPTASGEARAEDNGTLLRHQGLV